MGGVGREAGGGGRVGGQGLSHRCSTGTSGLSSLRETLASVLRLPLREGFPCILYTW